MQLVDLDLSIESSHCKNTDDLALTAPWLIAATFGKLNLSSENFGLTGGSEP